MLKVALKSLEHRWQKTYWKTELKLEIAIEGGEFEAAEEAIETFTSPLREVRLHSGHCSSDRNVTNKSLGLEPLSNT